MATANIPLSAGDGYTQEYSNSSASSAASWVKCQAATGDTPVVFQTASVRAYLQIGGPFLYDNTIERAHLPFDITTALVPSGSTITGGVLKLYVTAKDTSGGDSSVYVTSSTQASLTALAASDYLLADGATTYNDTHAAFSGVSTSAYLDVTLNASAVAAMSPGGSFKCSVRCEADVLDTGYPAAAGFGLYKDISLTFNGSRAASNKSYLEITYTPPPGGGSTRRRRPLGLYIR